MLWFYRPLILALLFGLLAVLRITAPSDLLEGDQVKQIGYVMDILHHGDWIVQYEITGDVATKPPLYNWLAAGLCKIFGTHDAWVMKLPSLLASIGLLVCLYVLGCYWFDERVGFYACLTCIASHHFSKLMWFARTDMLLSFLVLLPITLLVTLRWKWWKSPLIGVIVGLAGLTKGPIGPALFGVFLLAWGWHHNGLRSRLGWRRLLPGLALCTVICGAWLIAAWQLPRFEDTAIRWQLGTRMADPEKARSLFYYIGHLLTRIAPWPILAGIGVWMSRRRIERRDAQFLLLWFVLFFVVFSLIPVKRHDHLFPVYPAVFLLAGLGLMYPLSAILVASPVLFPWTQQSNVAAMITGAFICGAAAGWCFLKRQRISFAVVAAGLICLHGVYHHWLHRSGRADYDQILAFVDHVRCNVPPEDKVVVFYAHPLIAYELNQHERLQDPEQLVASHPQYVITPDYFKDLILEKTNWNLTPLGDMTILPREDRATLFRVDPPLQLSSDPGRTVR
jgi:4-amino-4-deoxy-L-arabinose transferase-like glycosyltransferase